MSRRKPTLCQLKEFYYRLRRQSSFRRDEAGRFEFCPWKYSAGTAKRRNNGWEVRVYPVDDGIEVCLIDPDGNSRTYA